MLPEPGLPTPWIVDIQDQRTGGNAQCPNERHLTVGGENVTLIWDGDGNNYEVQESHQDNDGNWSVGTWESDFNAVRGSDGHFSQGFFNQQGVTERFCVRSVSDDKTLRSAAVCATKP
jgi:hypothetical protein